MSPWLEHVLAHALPIGLRAGGLMTFAPFFGDDGVPTRVKTGFTIVLTAMLYGVCPVPDFQLNAVNWLRIVIGEAGVGLLMGLSVRVVLEGMQIAGQLAGAQLGFSLAAIIDPQTNIETPVLAVFHQMIALLIFLQLNVHHWLLHAIVKSFDYLPVGTVVVTRGTVEELVRAAGAMWLIGVQVAAPILLATMLVDVTVGFLSKASPQLPALFIGISAKSLIGYVVLAAAAALWPRILEGQFTNALGWSERMLHLSH
ncbi:MAG TPA: flagellar biosynthetic protein FliR [Candidatus Acidoferrales bacterium]|nr:flagellar biosynthetic protein FliR [Candidatus Acidoferrales bacterium]